jgi:hypothetical protein
VLLLLLLLLLLWFVALWMRVCERHRGDADAWVWSGLWMCMCGPVTLRAAVFEALQHGGYVCVSVRTRARVCVCAPCATLSSPMASNLTTRDDLGSMLPRPCTGAWNSLLVLEAAAEVTFLVGC